eukprot:5731893-Pyramimonas_sp.AAC.1
MGGEFLVGCPHAVVMLQEHHISANLLADAQARVTDMNWQGLWSAAKETGSASGAQSGLAILARPTVLVTRAP